MLHIIESGLVSVVLGALFAIPGIILGFWLKRTQLAPNRSWLSLTLCIVLAVIQQFWLPNLTYFWLALISVVGSTLGVYRMDIYWAINQTKPKK
jgi:hypothetical protein